MNHCINVKDKLKIDFTGKEKPNSKKKIILTFQDPLIRIFNY
jgi:hypothetical protein